MLRADVWEMVNLGGVLALFRIFFCAAAFHPLLKVTKWCHLAQDYC